MRGRLRVTSSLQGFNDDCGTKKTPAKFRVANSPGEQVAETYLGAGVSLENLCVITLIERMETRERDMSEDGRRKVDLMDRCCVIAATSPGNFEPCAQQQTSILETGGLSKCTTVLS